MEGNVSKGEDHSIPRSEHSHVIDLTSQSQNDVPKETEAEKNDKELKEDEMDDSDPNKPKTSDEGGGSGELVTSTATGQVNS